MASKARLAGIIGAGVLAIAGSVIAPYEGRSLFAYLDPVGVPTICEGVTEGVEMGDTATDAECDAALQREMRKHLAGVEECIDGYLTPNQWAAVLSWTYNVGVGAACTSTLVAKINRGEPSRAWCPELKRWVYAGGVRLGGLVKRRDAEYALCMGEA
jgi:lysozyme